VRAVELRGLRKSYRSRRGPAHAVRGVDLDVAPGEVVALLGPNGAGKSTTIDLLLGLQAPDGGTARLFGGPSEHAIRAGRVGVMLQGGAVVRDLTVREVVAMTATLYPSALGADEALAVAGLAHLSDRRTERLSGGEVQRLRFAVALVGRPELLVLDEPTVGMDVESRRAFWSTVRAAADNGTAVLFATHYLDEADAHADRVVLLADGRVAASGSPTQIRARVGGRTIHATLPDVAVEEIRRLPAVTGVDRHGHAVTIASCDSDATLRALLGAYDEARDIEVHGARLEDAFLELTNDGRAR
jgi:ABC-2 type transport system ATP-binding protein